MLARRCPSTQHQHGKNVPIGAFLVLKIKTRCVRLCQHRRHQRRRGLGGVPTIPLQGIPIKPFCGGKTPVPCPRRIKFAACPQARRQSLSVSGGCLTHAAGHPRMGAKWGSCLCRYGWPTLSAPKSYMATVPSSSSGVSQKFAGFDFIPAAKARL